MDEYEDPGLNSYDRKNLSHVLLHGDWWTAHFLRLLSKSDRPHRERLRLAFPKIVEQFEAWEEGQSYDGL